MGDRRGADRGLLMFGSILVVGLSDVTRHYFFFTMSLYTSPQSGVHYLATKYSKIILT